MNLYKVVVEEEIIAYQHTTYEVEAEDEDDAFERCCNGEGRCVEQILTDTCGSTGSSFELVEVEEIDG